MAEPQLRRMTPDEFFAWQEKQDKLYELVDGLPVLHIKMMTGATRAHDRVVTNLIRHLGNQLAGTGCWPTTSDLAVLMPSGDVRRPDVTVECGRGDRRDLSVREPRVIIEVLSPSTMTFDRFRKLPEYQTLSTVSDVLLIDTEAPRIDHWSRQVGSEWARHKIDGIDATVHLQTIGVSLQLLAIFEEIDFGSR